MLQYLHYLLQKEQVRLHQPCPIIVLNTQNGDGKCETATYKPCQSAAGAAGPAVVSLVPQFFPSLASHYRV